MSALAPYPGPRERERALDELAARSGGELYTFGESVEGRPLRALRVSRPGVDAPVAMVVANIHGPEFISAKVALAVGEESTRPETQLAELCKAVELHIIPCLNPDGYARTCEADGAGKLAELRANARGVDLNRNFPLPRGARRWPIPGAGSPRPGAATYHGPEPLSEPETAALAKLARELRPRVVFGLHSFMGTLIPAHVRSRRSYAQYRRLCAAMASAQPRAAYRRLAARRLDVFTGEQEDFMHHHLDAWAVCLESFPVRASLAQHIRAPSLFWRFNPRDPRPWVENDTQAIIEGCRVALATPRPSEFEAVSRALPA